MSRQAIRYVVNRQAYIILGHVILAITLVLSYGCKSCPSGTTVGWCVEEEFTITGKRYSSWQCCFDDVTGVAIDNCCPPPAYRALSLSQIPKPDLSYTNLDGLVDFGKTTLKVKMPSDGDTLEAKMKGRIAIIGGVCGKPTCDMEWVFVRLTSVQENFKTAKGKTVSGVFLRNANTWTGKRLNNGTITMDSGNKLALEAIIDGEKKMSVLNVKAYFGGALYYNVPRLTNTGTRYNNRIAITGNFADEDVEADLTISIWATNCEPVIQPSVKCLPDIDLSGPDYVFFDADFELLANLQSSQDLCDALKAEDYPEICTSAGTEFHTFYCQKQQLPPLTNSAEIAKRLKFSWQDAGGYVFSNEPSVFLDYMPLFPVTLSVENEWGKIVTAELSKAPQDPHCPKCQYVYAMNPYPSDDAIHTNILAILSWSSGGFAVSHEIYFSENFDDVNDGTEGAFRGNQISTFFVVGFPGFPYPDGLVPGTTYYWRIDEVNDTEPNSPWIGDVWSFWIPPKTAYSPNPADGDVEVFQSPTLSWLPGMNAVEHRIYFGDDFDTVQEGTEAVDKGALSETSFDAGLLRSGTTYYWRVDETDVAGQTHVGDVWSFTTITFLTIEDFERYTDNLDAGMAIFQTWIDGFENGTGSTVGYSEAIEGTFGERVMVHGGKQSLPFEYNDFNEPYYSETERTWNVPQDWTINEMNKLTLFIRGQGSNNFDQPLYVGLEDSSASIAIVANPNLRILTALAWTEWSIPFSQFAGVNVTAIKKMYIGVGDHSAPIPGGMGLIYIDDIRATPP